MNSRASLLVAEAIAGTTNACTSSERFDVLFFFFFFDCISMWSIFLSREELSDSESAGNLPLVGC